MQVTSLQRQKSNKPTSRKTDHEPAATDTAHTGRPKAKKRLVQSEKKKQMLERQELKKALLAEWKQRVQSSTRARGGEASMEPGPGGVSASEDAAQNDDEEHEPGTLATLTSVRLPSPLPSEEEKDMPDGDDQVLVQEEPETAESMTSTSDENEGRPVPAVNSKGHPTTAQKVPRSIFRKDETTQQPQTSCQRCEVLEARIRRLEEQLARKGKYQ